MKAVIIDKLGTTPVLKDINNPEIKNSRQRIITMRAVPLKNFDRLRTSENFYAKYTTLPAIIGSDGVGSLEDGTRVYATGNSGTYAEKISITKDDYTILPESLEDAIAAALPNAVLGSVAPLRLRGNIRKGNTVLINGATGFTGQIAVQVARYLGAGRVIATGRDGMRLRNLLQSGATEIISLKQSDDQIREQLTNYLRESPVDIVLDYLWGPPAALLINILHDGPTHPVRFINLGNNAGVSIGINANTIRNSAIEILGAGAGSYTSDEYALISAAYVPEMFQLAAKGVLSVPVQREPIEQIEKVWNLPSKAGKRVVFTFS